MTAPESPTVLIRMSPELVEQLEYPWQDVVWDFGGPDADGFYSPTIYRRYRKSLWMHLRDWWTSR